MGKQRMQHVGVWAVVGALAVLAVARSAQSATVWVGPTETYTTIQAATNAASSGDTIYIDSGTYVGNQCFANINKNLTLIGIGPTRPIMDGTGSSLNGQGIWIVSAGVTVSIQNIEFRNCACPAGNGAAVWSQGAASIGLSSCVIHDCQNGFFSDTGTGTVLLDSCVFHDNGDSGSMHGYTHNILAGGTSVMVRYCWSYNANGGYCLQARGKTNYIQYNRLGDEQGLALTSGSAHQGNVIDVPSGGLTYVMGNVIQDATDAVDGRLVRYGEAGITAGCDTQAYLVYNTLLSRRTGEVAGFELNGLAAPAYVANNCMVLADSGNLAIGWVVNNSAMINSNIMLWDDQGQNPPAMCRYMYDATGQDAKGNPGPAGTYETWDVLNVRPIDPNTMDIRPGVTYKTLLDLALLPGTNWLALPATGKDGTSLTPNRHYIPMGPTLLYANATPSSGEIRWDGRDVGAYGARYTPPPPPPPVIRIDPLPLYIYEGWTVNLTATVTWPDPDALLCYMWTQTTGQSQMLMGATTLNASFTVPARSLTSAANELLTFKLTVTNCGFPPLSVSASTSTWCYLCGDVNHDNGVNLADLKLLVAAWNSAPASGNWSLAADLDNTGSINLGDLKLLVANWNRSLP